MSRRDDWHALDDVRASIGDFLDQVGREPLRIDVGHSTFEVTRRGETLHVECYGAGGGWYDHRRMDRNALVRYVRAQETAVRVRRPESQRHDDAA